MIQLDLFTPTADIDHRVADIGHQLVEHLTQSRTGLVIHRVMHPDTFAEMAPNLSDRSTWKDPAVASASINHKRIKMFQNTPTCVCCGRTISVYTVEQSGVEGSLPHVNAYSVSTSGIHEMTVDHIVPKGLCGSDSVVNRVTKCRPCNHDKAVLMSQAEIEMVNGDIERYIKEWANLEFVKTALEFQRFIHTLKDHATRKRALGVLNVCAQRISMRTQRESYKKRIKQMTNCMNVVNPPIRTVVPVQLPWWKHVWMFSYELLTFFPK